MSRWRLIIIVTLFLTPFVFLMGMGSYALFEKGWAFWTWWPMALLISLSFLLAWYWQKRKRLMPDLEFTPPPHGSERDEQAWRIVTEFAKATDAIEPDQLSETGFYLDRGQELGLQLARYYHPGARDPYGTLTVPEILAVCELAARDLSDLVKQYVPGSHVLTVNDYRRAVKAYKWFKHARNLYWLASAVFSPLETAARYAAARFGTGASWDLLQQNVMLWFYTAYIHRLGAHLIELHSGRLRVGVDRYRDLMAQYGASPPAPVAAGAPPASTDGAPVAPAGEVTLSIIGQVKVGKSSLINALLGDQRAITDVLPATNQITRYQLQPTNVSSKLVLLDTIGYGHEGPKEDQVRVTEVAAQQSDLMLLVLHARNPARKADVELLDRLMAWYAENPQLRIPAIVGVVTHIDLLSPAMEWSPPYNWREPQRHKEQQIHEALKAVATQFAHRLAAVVPVCATPGKVYGIDEALLPVIVEKLGEARGVALLRLLKSEADTGKVRRVFEQLINAGREIAQMVWLNAAK